MLRLCPQAPPPTFQRSISQYAAEDNEEDGDGGGGGGCDLAAGSWVHSGSSAPAPPYADGCPFVRYQRPARAFLQLRLLKPPLPSPAEIALNSQENCRANGRPDTEYLHWRWQSGRWLLAVEQPAQCDLEPFDAAAFLAMLAGRRLGIVGDSITRNLYEALMCLLWAADPDIETSQPAPSVIAHAFPRHNATVELVFSVYLVADEHPSETHTGGACRLHLDHPDATWAARLPLYDALVAGSGSWWASARPKAFHKGGPDLDLDPLAAYTEGLRAFSSALDVVQFAGPVVFHSNLPEHWVGQGGIVGNATGQCTSTNLITDTAEMESRMYAEEGGITGAARKPNFVRYNEQCSMVFQGTTVDFMDLAYMSAFRKDGHPGFYRRPPRKRRKTRELHDCKHWCVPGVPDAWAQVLHATLAAAWRRRRHRLGNLMPSAPPLRPVRDLDAG
eukprot:SM000337S12892  [mRNA]  locus=s337:74938:77527:+ [translate_table: standard]